MVKQFKDPDDETFYTVEECLNFLPYGNSYTIRTKIKEKKLKAKWCGHRVGYRIKGLWIKEFKEAFLNGRDGDK